METITISRDEYKALVDKAARLDAVVRFAQAKTTYDRVDVDGIYAIAGAPYEKEEKNDEEA